MTMHAKLDLHAEVIAGARFLIELHELEANVGRDGSVLPLLPTLWRTNSASTARQLSQLLVSAALIRDVLREITQAKVNGDTLDDLLAVARRMEA